LSLGRVQPVIASPQQDATLLAIADLRSGDRARIEQVTLAPELIPYALPLLAWPPVATSITDRLRDMAPRTTGALVDALLDPRVECAGRGRLRPITAAGNPPVAAPGLWCAIHDSRFEVRYRVGKAIAQMRAAGHPLPATTEQVYDAIEREVCVDA